MRKMLLTILGFWLGAFIVAFFTHRVIMAFDDALLCSAIFLIAYSIYKLIKLSKK